MLPCRSLFRVDRVLKFTNTCVQSKRVNYLQGHSSCYTLSCGAKDKQSAMGRNRKRKIINPVWRPVCTQANSVEECLVNNVTVETEDGGQVQQVQDSISGYVSSAQNAVEVAEAVNKVSDVTLNSRTLQDNGEERDLEGDSVVSAEKHSLSLEVGVSVIRFIRGKEGSTQKKIEEEMGVKITFPSSKKEDSIIIEGNSVDSVTRASEKIQTIIDEAVKSPNLEYSHFVSLPLAIHTELVDKLVDFQNSVLGNSDASPDENSYSDSNEDTSENEDKDHQLEKGSDVAVELKVEDDSNHVKVDIKSVPLVSYLPKASRSPTLSDLGIEKSIFIKPKTFHLTVLMLKLWNKDRVNAASEVLKSISSEVMDALDNRPVFVRLKGLDCMRGSLAKARVLYAPVEEIGNEDRLLRACQVITDAFVNAGLVLEKDAKQKLKLHATVMNARHRKRKRRTRKFDSFDARGIFKQFGSQEWGEYLIHEAHLSQRFAFDESGYYHCCASIPFLERMQVVD